MIMWIMNRVFFWNIFKESICIKKKKKEKSYLLNFIGPAMLYSWDVI